MDSSSLITLAVGAILANALILYLVISGATKSHKRSLYEWAQLDLLSKIAKAQGVPPEDIADTFVRAGLSKPGPVKPVTNPYPILKD